MLRRLVVVLLVPLAFALAGCAETVVGDGQIAEGAAPTNDAPPTDDPTDEPTDGPTAGPTSSSDEEPANADNKETWAYTDGLEMTITKIEPYDGGAGIILDGEFAILTTYHLENASPDPVELSGDGDLTCEDGDAIDAFDSNLPEMTGTLAPGEKKDFQQGWAIQNAAHGKTCQLEYTPGSNYFPALFEFTAP